MNFAALILMVSPVTGPAILPPAPQSGACPASKVGGSIGRIDPIDSAKPAVRPIRLRGSQPPVRVGEGAPICAGDIIRNPAGSNARIVIRVAGGARPRLEPGRDFAMPTPSFFSGITDAYGRFDTMVRTSFASILTLGPGDTGPDASLPPEAYAVAEWGPLLLYLPADRRGSGLQATVRSSGGARTLPAPLGWLWIDTARDCPAGCSVSFTDAGGLVATVRVHLVSLAEAPHLDWMPERPTLPVDRAMLGVFLAKPLGDPGWEIQGYSLLWSAACAAPAAHLVVADHYHGMADADPCTGGGR